MKNASALGAMARLVKRSMSLRRKIASGLSQRLAAWRLFLMKRGQRRVFDSLAQQHGDRFIALAEADVSRFCTPAWLARTREAQAALWPRPSNAFLKEPFIRQTMAVESRELMARELSFLEERYSVQLLRQLLMEDVVGTPTILSPRYLTSGTSVHHFCHAASYEVATGVSLRGLRSVVEWGGGYGDMAKLLLRMNPSLVYTIVDIPIF
ncbi:MAG: hypothetical protein FJ290_33190, partial [Planctomycetes bacterium]|nr:hypothetical protein [Planctomycetota bacterium]